MLGAPARYACSMGVFKSLVDKAKEKKDELAREAAKKAAKTALEQGAKAALGALDATGKAIEDALFGEARGGQGEAGEAKDEKPARSEPEDPFVRVNAAEAAKKRDLQRERESADLRAGRAAKAEADEKEIDAELLALKKKLGK